MSLSAIERLLRPKTIAVIGGGTWCQSVINTIRSLDFSGNIWPVHPTKNQIAGTTTYRFIEDLPSAPDAAFIGINRHATIDAVKSLHKMGAGGAVCFASGFLESSAETGDGADLQQQLLNAAGDLAILGPNCYGFLNYLDGVGLWPDHHGGVRVESGVAILTQSSNIALNITMQQRGLPLAFTASVGNQAQIGMSELGLALLEDPRISALGLHIEGIDNMRSFEALAQRAAELNKSIVALKVGASESSQAATISHTASLAGSQAGALATFKRLGIGVVHSLPALVETLKLLHTAGRLPSNRIASASCSGGEASLMADSALITSVEFVPLNEAQKVALRAALGPKVALANPLDYHTYIWGDEAALTATFSALADESLAMVLVILDFPRPDRCTFDDWQLVLNAIKAARDIKGVPMGVVASLGENMPESIATRLVAQGITPFCGIDEALSAISVAARLAKAPQRPPILQRSTAKVSDKKEIVLSEFEAKCALEPFGIPLPQAFRLTDDQSLRAIVEQLPPKVVLKGEGFAHKSEAGAVRLNLVGVDEIMQAMHSMNAPSYLIEEMVEGGIVELLVGVVYDSAHGFVLTLALGGVWTELMRDSVSLMLPTDQQEIKCALNELHIAPLLNGYRGAPSLAIEGIVNTVLAVQNYVVTHQDEVQEVEINPLIVGHDFVIAVDALIKLTTK